MELTNLTPRQQLRAPRLPRRITQLVIGLTLYGKRGDLTNIGAVFEGAGGDGLVDLEGFVKELDRGNEHVFKGRTLVGWGQIGLVYMPGRRGVVPGSGWGSAGGKKDSLVLPQNDGSTATGG